MSFEFISIPENLRQEELIVQLANRLKLINLYSETLFQHIGNKLNDVQCKLEDINHRSEICTHKISQLKDEKKAITLYSHSKFPSREIKVNEFYQSYLINNQDKKPIILEEKQINATHIPYDDDTKMKSQFYIYDKQINRYPIPDHLSEAYIPWQHISSLSSLLLFNSSENAYTLCSSNFLKSTRLNSKRTMTTTKNEDDSQKNGPTNDKENLDFQLTFHSTPQILNDLPTELPSLPGIADEFNFEDSDELDSIDVSQLNLPDLTLLSKVTFAPSPTTNREDNEPTNIVGEFPISHNDISTPPLITPPPPPPPPPSSLLIVSNDPSLIKDENSSIPKEKTSGIVSMNSLNDTSRASLLESIRAAGGKPKKKTIKERKHDEKLKKKDAEEAINRSNGPANDGMDMMAELRKRLESRRSGISNDQTFKNNEPLSAKMNQIHYNSAMANMSAMIPPPADVTTDDELDEENNFEDWDFFN